jgi:hypothetical protein
LQWNTGFRYLAPVVPGMLVLALQVLQRWPVPVRGVVLAATVLHGWLIAAMHLAPRAAMVSLAEYGYATASFRWMARLGLIDAPVPWSGILTLTSLVVVWLGVRGRVTCRA